MSIWPFAYADDRGILERIEWLTEVLPSRNGKEQRQQVRGAPRRTYEFQITAGEDARRARIENFLIAHHAKALQVPVWPDSDQVGPLSAGATVVSFDTAGKDYVVGGKAVISDGLTAEAVTISGVASGSITVSALVADWPALSYIAPACSAYLTDSITTSNPWTPVLSGTVRFESEKGWNYAAATEAVDYRGYPVKMSSSLWALEGTTAYQREISGFDPGVGSRAVFDPTGVENTLRQYRVALPNRAEIAAYRAFLFARAGRRNPLWMASGQCDLTITANIGSADATISINNIGYAAMGLVPIGRRDIVIETVTGTKYYRRITGASAVSATTETISIDSALGVALTTADIKCVSFMRLSRLQSDSVEISHRWPGVAESRIALFSLRDDV